MQNKIERRALLSGAEFADQFLYAHRPVVITEAMRQWKALSRWTPEFFRAQFGDMKFQLADANHRLVDFTMASFIDCVLASTEEKPAPYFRNIILSQQFPTLMQDIEPLPEYFFPTWLGEKYLLKNVQRVFNRGSAIEIYIGGTGGAFPVLHYDGLASHAFLMQIYGRKRFILFSPDQEPFMYVRPEEPNLSRVNDVEHPDLQSFPLFAKATPISFVLEPGEMVFIPARWWHTTKMLTPSISVSANLVNSSNWAALTDFVVSKRRPILRFPTRIYLNRAGAWRTRRDRANGRRNLS